MSIEVPRVIQCGCCGRKQAEAEYGTGWPNWGQIKGVVFNNAKEPLICPACLTVVMDSLDAAAHSMREVN